MTVLVGDVWEVDDGNHQFEIVRLLHDDLFEYRFQGMRPDVPPGVASIRVLQHYRLVYRDDDEVPL